MRVILMMLLMTLVSCCRGKKEVKTVNGETIKDRSNDYETICINGVAYYYAYHRLAIRFDPKTKQVVTCE